MNEKNKELIQRMRSIAQASMGQDAVRVPPGIHALLDGAAALEALTSGSDALGELSDEAVLVELLESYEAVFRSAHCQLDADTDLIDKARAILRAGVVKQLSGKEQA